MSKTINEFPNDNFLWVIDASTNKVIGLTTIKQNGERFFFDRYGRSIHNMGWGLRSDITASKFDFRFT